MPLWTQLLRDLAKPRRGWLGRPPRALGLSHGPIWSGTEVAGDVPWCAPGVWVAALVRPPRRGGRAGFSLAGLTPSPVAPGEVTAAGEALRLAFRLPTPSGSATAELLWRGRPVGRADIRVVTESDYRAGLVAESGVVARLGPHHVAAGVVAARQCRGLVAALTLRHAGGLLPLSSLGVSARYDRRGAPGLVLPVALDAARLGAGSLTIAVPLPGPGLGRAAVTWQVGGAAVARDGVRGVGGARLRAGVRVAEAGFVVVSGGTSEAVRHPPPRYEGAIGPRFALACRPGWAGMVSYEVRAAGGGPSWGGRALVTGEPARLPLGLLSAGAELTGFELVVGGVAMGGAQARPVPSATFTAEGKFAPPPDFPWTPAADDELADRLGRLE